MVRTGPQGAEVIEVRILSEEYGSDHLPVEAIFEFPALDTTKTDAVVSHRALGSPNQQNTEPDKATEDTYAVGARIFVKREELYSVATSAQRLWIPATVKEIQGQLIRVRVDTTWLQPARRQEQGVTIQGIKPLPPGQYLPDSYWGRKSCTSKRRSGVRWFQSSSATATAATTNTVSSTPGQWTHA
jgi:hypothetical protein